MPQIHEILKNCIDTISSVAAESVEALLMEDCQPVKSTWKTAKSTDMRADHILSVSSSNAQYQAVIFLASRILLPQSLPRTRMRYKIYLEKLQIPSSV
ncbi:hypothetical protein CALK_1281 [Chitinivibrio alkaliphilus ACht1]|uniref:Uncharacterized protein n=1 Tax=Chitinivibrio alkaliphilus ACht1 TaxID=1313304 RepID=U7D7D5_9BACT|nr:hypothetical protein CALK_1281 [Chitinivibrio alkaliphilus ACht1]